MAANGIVRLTYINGRGWAEVIRMTLGAAEIEVRWVGKIIKRVTMTVVTYRSYIKECYMICFILTLGQITV